MAAADAKSTYAIELKDDTSGAAAQAAGALVQLKAKIDDDVKALRAMQAAMRNLKGNTVVSAQAAKELSDRIAAQKAKIAQAQASYVQLGGTFGKITPKAEAASGGLADMLAQAAGLPGPLGSIATRLGAIGGAALPVAAAVMAVAGAMLALVTATAAATAALLRYGIAQSNARRAELLRFEGLNLLPRAYGFARASAESLQFAIDRASASTSLGRDELGRYAQQLSRAGLRGAALAEGLDAIGIAATAAGERGAAFARRLVVATARSGGDVAAMAERLEAHFGPVARRVLLDWDVQIDRLRRNLETLFSGLRIEGFLQGVSEIAALFSQSTVTGRVLKGIVESLFQPIIDFASGSVMTLVKRFFQGMALGALHVERLILRLQIALMETFGPSSIFAGLDLENAAFAAGAATIIVLASAVALAAAGLAAMGAAAGAVLVPFGVLVAAVSAFGAMVGNLAARVLATNWAELGTSIVDGLISGIRGGTRRVTSAIRDLAGQARQALRTALDIHSPSRVFAREGLQIAAGVTVGIEDGMPEVGRAVEHLVDVPTRAATGGGGGGAGRAPITIGEVHIHTQATDAQGIAEDFAAQLARVLEGMAITTGAAPA